MRGRFTLVTEKAIDDLDEVDRDDGRPGRGFRYESKADGDYDFALQFVFSDGERSPRDQDLTAYRRVRIDTHPPTVRAAPDGPFGVPPGTWPTTTRTRTG